MSTWVEVTSPETLRRIKNGDRIRFSRMRANLNVVVFGCEAPLCACWSDWVLWAVRTVPKTDSGDPEREWVLGGRRLASLRHDRDRWDGTVSRLDGTVSLWYKVPLNDPDRRGRKPPACSGNG